MTTNAIDRVKLQVTSDSRWSIPLPNANNPTHVAFIDDTGFEKISVSRYGAIVFAGDGLLISLWKTWFKQPLPMVTPPPPTEREVAPGVWTDVNICLITTAGRVLYDWGHCVTHGDSARFSGSGKFFARDCFAKNGCSMRAIDTAGVSDPFTGGTTRYVELHSGISNLTKDEATLQDAERMLNEGGSLMELATGIVTPLKDARDSMADALHALQNGPTLSAPTGHPSRKWSDDEKMALQAALQEMFAAPPAEQK
ncbi:hypothetical protein [Pseudomonas sp. LFM046]|uniref:hypothetical protein n=1 Tax=Pseudomonas sp. LFM046 TaxID=1608357 RepID=UPI0005CFE2EF|nr:hypothetical protein [Pseudomonas sp. LFM046]